MKIVVIGGTGLIGSQVVKKLRDAGHEALPASPSVGVNTITGEGLEQALSGAEVVIDVPNSPSFDDEVALKFFQTSTTNLLAAEAVAGVRHHLILSIVGVDQLPHLGYYRAKVAQEELLKAGSIPYSIIRATQFFEFISSIMKMTTDGAVVRLPSTLLQPIASADVVATLVDTATGAPVQGILNVAGPEAIRLDELGRLSLAAKPDARSVVTDENAGMFGGGISDRVLTAGDDALITQTRFEDWLVRS